MALLRWLKFFRYNPFAIEVAARYAWKRRSGRPLLGVGVLGCGGGGLMHTSHYLWHLETDVRAVFDPSGRRFADLDKRFPYMDRRVLRTTDLQEVLRRPDIDLISVCTPDHTHADYVVAALEAGKHVLCEKPMCTTLEDCERIIRAADGASTVFLVFQQMRFVPRNVAIKRLIDSGALGEVFYAETGYIHDMRHRVTEFSRWRLDPRQFQHPIFGGCHHIDLIRWLAGEIDEAHTLGCHKALPDYPADDTYVTAMRLRSGAVCQVLTTFGPRVPTEFHPIRIYGTRGSIHDGTVFLDNGSRVESRPLGAREYRGAPDFRAQISHFVDCVRGRTEPLVAARDGARTVAACWAAIESWRTGRPVAVPQIDGAPERDRRDAAAGIRHLESRTAGPEPMILRVDHLGIAVRDAEPLLPLWEKLGFTVGARGLAPAYATHCQFLSHANVELELVFPAGPGSSVSSFLERRGEGLHHIALEVDDLEAEMERLRAAGMVFVDAHPQKGAKPGMKVAFLHPASTRGVLVELVEYRRGSEGESVDER
ncbi:MAG: Gfo/Idh/MocA family oxidoreductase [Gemmatimonadetes bacterium]|nr:Gfo/Idh/MocA family oxidoreductase [Gemmatimonadota bacterium]